MLAVLMFVQPRSVPETEGRSKIAAPQEVPELPPERPSTPEKAEPEQAEAPPEKAEAPPEQDEAPPEQAEAEIAEAEVEREFPSRQDLDEDDLIGAGISADNVEAVLSHLRETESTRAALENALAIAPRGTRLPLRKQLMELDAEDAAALGDDYPKVRGALGEDNTVIVNKTLRKSPAMKAGLLKGDVVREYNDTKIYSTDQLSMISKESKGKSDIYILIERDGRLIQLKIDGGPLGMLSDGESRP